MEEKLKIFFCEDDENLGMLLREYLQAKGYVTDLFSDGEAGYKGFTKGKYDLCVLDVMMPKKDGFTLAQEIRSINPDIPIIFLIYLLYSRLNPYIILRQLDTCQFPALYGNVIVFRIYSFCIRFLLGVWIRFFPRAPEL